MDMVQMYPDGIKDLYSDEEIDLIEEYNDKCFDECTDEEKENALDYYNEKSKGDL